MFGLTYGQTAMTAWFALYGMLAVTNFRFEQEHLVMGVLALATAVLTGMKK